MASAAAVEAGRADGFSRMLPGGLVRGFYFLESNPRIPGAGANRYPSQGKIRLLGDGWIEIDDFVEGKDPGVRGGWRPRSMELPTAVVRVPADPEYGFAILEYLPRRDHRGLPGVVEGPWSAHCRAGDVPGPNSAASSATESTPCTAEAPNTKKLPIVDGGRAKASVTPAIKL